MQKKVIILFCMKGQVNASDTGTVRRCMMHRSFKPHTVCIRLYYPIFEIKRTVRNVMECQKIGVRERSAVWIHVHPKTTF